jgi:hypothetical protein
MLSGRMLSSPQPQHLQAPDMSLLQIPGLVLYMCPHATPDLIGWKLTPARHAYAPDTHAPNTVPQLAGARFYISATCMRQIRMHPIRISHAYAPDTHAPDTVPQLAGARFCISATWPASGYCPRTSTCVPSYSVSMRQHTCVSIRQHTCMCPLIQPRHTHATDAYRLGVSLYACPHTCVSGAYE